MSEDLKQFKEKGYVVFRGLLTKEEVNRLRESMEKDQTLQENEHSRGDAMGKRIRVSLWTTVPKSITGTIVRAEKVVSKVEKLLEGEVYHYHSKLIMKDPKTGGAFLWHQDYGYWYDYNCLFPTMGTLWVAVDKADKTNGCLQAPDNEIMTCPLTCDGEDVKFYSTENVISGLEKKAET
ncbi:uncharacterized protein LOC135465834 isoform X2 [Liolophura sinensis]|uniref:uncharacterized protein LOC135465834 isoform X2 n=1 Tax=Liolophura sinensis TaxID=3198878 RepID=UPI0031596B53